VKYSDELYAVLRLTLIIVVAPYKAWICGRSHAGTAGSNPVTGMDGLLL